MVAHINSLAFAGIETIDVDVQTHLASGLPSFNIVGLGDKAVSEAKERIRAAFHAMGMALPPKRITVNLAPADLAKEGSHFDLPIALGLMVNIGVLQEEEIAPYVVMGELSLDGSISSVSGVLPAAIGAAARDKGIICPKENGEEAAWAGEIDILAPNGMLELINHFKGNQILSRPTIKPDSNEIKYPDLSDIKGQETARRALEVAAAGGHNMLMVGPPGSGKSMLASRLPGIIPPMDAKEMLDASVISSIAGMVKESGLTRRRPFRDPHHNCSMAAMIGGGTKAKPGEVTLAHNGILFLDEFPEFPRQVLDSLRQPMETRNVTVSRVQAHITYPADFQLVAAMNPCRCGYLDDADRSCNRVPKCAVDYQSKISGPLLDRIDIHVEVPAVKPGDIFNDTRKSEASAIVAARVKAAREIQIERYRNTATKLNSSLDGGELIKHASPDVEGGRLLEQGVERLGLSMRGYNRILRVARTIADMEASEIVRKKHISEALSYRQLTPRKMAKIDA